MGRFIARMTTVSTPFVPHKDGTDVVGLQVLAALHAHHELAHVLLVEVAEEFQAMKPRVRALLLALEGLRFHERDRPPLELNLAAPGEVARGNRATSATFTST